jgi:hypothetical protein
MTDRDDDIKPETAAVRTQVPVSSQREHSVPIYATSSFVYDDSEEMRAAFADEIQRNIYSRFTNPNVAELSEKIRILEGAEAGHSTATGMAAVFATFAALLSAGDHLLCCRSIFGATHTMLAKILPRFGITHTYFDAWDPDSWDGLRTDRTGRESSSAAATAVAVGGPGEAAVRHRARGRRPGDSFAAAPPGRHPHQARQPRTGVLSAATLRLQPESVPDPQISHHDDAR